ncbi:MAG: butyrate kinase [Syntrophotaleaceae bacterium]
MKKHSLWRVLAINPGSTSTKVALFENEVPTLQDTLRHEAEELSAFPNIPSQFSFRLGTVLNWLKSNGVRIETLDAVVGRGGLLGPLESGTYPVNEVMLEEMRAVGQREHASNLGVLMAHEIAGIANIPAFTVDPVTVDELHDLARVSGLAGIERRSISHALNIKAVARRGAAERSACYEDLNLIVAHLGGGISVTAHQKGRMVDVSGGLDAGPFSPERTGSLPLLDVVELCFQGAALGKAEIKRKLIGQGGLVSYLGTNSAIEVGRRMREGDASARLVAEAMAYQIAKEIGAMAAVLKGDVDAVILTGGVVHWQELVEWIRERTGFIAPVWVHPGEDEMLALAQGALRVLRGEAPARSYTQTAPVPDPKTILQGAVEK